MARSFHEPVTVRVGRQTRELMLDPEAWRRCEKAFGGEDPAQALRRGSMTPVVVVAACALHHIDKKVTDKTVEAWVRDEPKSYPDLVEAVGEAVRRFLVVTGVLEEIASPGEDLEPPTP